ncbi:hypothetical protein M514_27392 [Trichuris suis]|uniref:Reverse transcriptase domain-containing protein n=1 Tax=Trichuris suis TaxID=68888 RepID=A0A085MT89_9BILA|nr:hypothetical protein M514_27392 [Trichuris suis]
MSLTKTEPRKAAEIKGIISSSLLQLNRYEKPNLNRLERDVIKNLRTKKDLVITKADKRNVVVLLDKPHYVDKMLSLLNSATYMPIQSDPTPQTRTELRGLLQIFAEQSKEDTISSIRNRLYYVSNSVCPELYGLPKVHKPGVPLRPVVCSVNRVTSHLCTYLKSIIQPLTGGRSSHVTNHRDFCAALKSIQISKTDFMSDPTPQTRTELRGLLQIFAEQSKEDTISSIRNRLYYLSNSACPELYGLLKIHKPGVPLRPVVCSVKSVTSQLCTYLKGIIQPLTGGRSSHVSNHKDFCVALKSIQISKTDFMGSFFRQNNGAPMGSPLSPVLAELFMEHLEETAFEGTDNPWPPVCLSQACQTGGPHKEY